MNNTISYAPAPYGRACANCVRAKCKCSIPETGGSCARCYRLNKECRPSNRVRRSKQPRRTRSKTAQLEQKLDGILSLLKDQTVPASSRSAFDEGRDDATAALLTPGDSTPHVDSPRVHLHTTEAEEEGILDSFRAGPLEYLPFVYIPDGVGAAELKEESPFLWLCITAVQCRHTARQTALSDSIRKKAATALLVECQKSLDLLQGLLVYLGWVTFHCQPQKSSLCTYVQLAISLVFDLGLNKPPPQDSNGTGPMHSLGPLASPVRTMNERRAVLSCFLLSSFISQFLSRPDPLRWTPHMRECLDHLAERNETPNDAVLVQLVHTQLIVDKILRHTWDDNEGHTGHSNVSRSPPSFFIQATQLQLQDIRNNLSQELAQNKVVLFHLHQAEVSLYETALTKITRTDDIDLTRLGHLYACLVAIKNWFDLLLTLPPGTYTSLPITIVFQISHCIMTLYRLSTYECPGWDRAAVRRTADLHSVSQQVVDRLIAVTDAAGIQNEGTDGDSWSKAAKFIPKLQAGWAAKLPAAPTPVDASEHLSSLPGDEGFLESYLAWPDTAWLMDSLVSGT